MSTVTTIISQHDNGASRPFSFLPKRRRSKSYSTTSFHEDSNDMSNDNNDDIATYPDYAATTSPPPQTHVFPTATKHNMHIDIPSSALIPAPPHPVRPPTFIRKKSGELVKPSLKSTSSFASHHPPLASTSPPSSITSRPRTTSAPATPMAHKSVHFDTQLERVKLFLSGQKPLAVSREGSPVDMDTTSASEAEPDAFGISSYPFPTPKSRYGAPAPSNNNNNPNSTSSSNPAVNKSQPQIRMKLKLIPIYTPLPISNSDVEPWSFDVRLESVRLSDSEAPSQSSDCQTAFPYLHGTILVHNKAFTKSVFFRYTLDDWNTVSEVSCKHVHTLPGGSYDRFEYRVKLIGLPSTRSEGGGERASNVAGSGNALVSGPPRFPQPPPRMEFCVRYNVPGWGEWWDSNSGRNYVLEFKWDSESTSSPLSFSSTVNQAKIVSPQPQRATANTGSTSLFQRMARHSIPFYSGTASPGHVSPPPHSGPGSASMLDQRPPSHSPSFPPSFPSLGHSDYFNYNKPQAMNIPLRSRYDFSVSLREGAKIIRPTVTSPPPSSRSPNAVTSGLPLTEGERRIFFGSPAIMSPTTTPGLFRRPLASPMKNVPQEPELVGNDKEDAGGSPSPSSSTVKIDRGPSLKIETATSSKVLSTDASTSVDAPSSPSLSPKSSGRRHVRSWIQTSMSAQDMSSNGDNKAGGGFGVRKTMSSPAGLASDETTSPASSEYQSALYSHSDPRPQRQSLHDGDEEEESEEDGIWFGRRSSGGFSDEAQSDYDILTNAMRYAIFSNTFPDAHVRTSPLLRFKNMSTLSVVDEGKEADREQDNDGMNTAEKEKANESSESPESSSSSSLFDSLTYIPTGTREEEAQKMSSPTSPASSVMWSLSSSTGSSDVSITPRVSTPPFESRTLPLLHAKHARDVLSGTPKTSSPLLTGVGNVDIVPPIHLGAPSEMLFPPVVTSPLSSEGSITPRGEIPDPIGSEPTSHMPFKSAGEVGSTSINLNSSSYHSLLDQFCFYTGASSAPIRTQTTNPRKQTSTTTGRSSPSPTTTDSTPTDRHGVSMSTRSIRTGGKPVGHGRSSSADPAPSSPYSLGHNFGLNFGFNFDGFTPMSMNESQYGIPKSLGRSPSDPSDSFLVRSSYNGEQVSGRVG